MRRLIICVVALIGTLAKGEVLGPVAITGFHVNGAQATLQWTGGRPTYQVQTCPALGGAWGNVGLPTSNTTATIQIAGSEGYFRVVSDYTALYRVTFDATWSQTTHPSNWTSNAHWSGLVGGTHKAGVHFFRAGETATEGIRLMAELGQKPQLLAEVGAAISNGTAHFQLSGDGIRPSPGTVSLAFPQPMQRDFPLVTLCSMVAPSPDWFVGVDSLNMIVGGQWVSNQVITLYSMDAGTDSGLSYESLDQVTVPRGVVAQHAGFPALQNGVIVPFGTFTFTRLD